MCFFFRKLKSGGAYWTQETHLFQDDVFVCSVCGFQADQGYAECPSCHAVMTKCVYDATWAEEADILDDLLDDD